MSKPQNKSGRSDGHQHFNGSPQNPFGQILDQALAEPGGAEGKRVVSIHKNVVTRQFEL